MRAVVQRVSRASVVVDENVVGKIDRGLLIYLGVGRGDGERERTWTIDKIIGLRIFSNGEGKMSDSVIDVKGSLLVVSQFTLYADLKRGRRPSFEDAMPPIEAEREYNAFVEAARTRISSLETGIFGAHMRVDAVNDGPVTILLDTKLA